MFFGLVEAAERQKKRREQPVTVDVVGINYYWTNQWEWRVALLPDGRVPPLADDDPRRVPLSALIRSVWERYQHELIISETAHIGENRGPWLREVTREAEATLNAGVPLRGVCLYPILGMPEWHEPDVWTPMGLWDPVCHRECLHERLLCEDMAEALSAAQHLDDLHRAGIAEDGKLVRLRPRQAPVSPGSALEATRRMTG